MLVCYSHVSVVMSFHEQRTALHCTLMLLYIFLGHHPRLVARRQSCARGLRPTAYFPTTSAHNANEWDKPFILTQQRQALFIFSFPYFFQLNYEENKARIRFKTIMSVDRINR